MQLEKTKDRALGRWKGILPAIGLPSKALANRHGPCPMCGGKDRFRFDDKGGTGSFYCNSPDCGAGDGIKLVMKFLRVDFKEACRRVDELAGGAPIVNPGNRQAPNDGQKREELIKLWKRAMPITPDDHAGRYLFSRTGLTVFSPNLRFAKDEPHADPGAKRTWHPVMVAKVEPSDVAAAQGERAAIHRTYLDTFGGKADVATPRKMLGSMPTGAAVRLMPHENALGIAEGIETALSASILYNMPVWAALTADLLENWSPPATVDQIVIFGDNDASSTGQAAAFGLAKRLKAKGLSAIVEIPQRVGDDWNDVHAKSVC